MASIVEIEQVYRDQRANLYYALLAYSGDPEVARDALAEAFARALASADRIKSGAVGVESGLSLCRRDDPRAAPLLGARRRDTCHPRACRTLRGPLAALGAAACSDRPALLRRIFAR